MHDNGKGSSKPKKPAGQKIYFSKNGTTQKRLNIPKTLFKMLPTLSKHSSRALSDAPNYNRLIKDRRDHRPHYAKSGKSRHALHTTSRYFAPTRGVKRPRETNDRFGETIGWCNRQNNFRRSVAVASDHAWLSLLVTLVANLCRKCQTAPFLLPQNVGN